METIFHVSRPIFAISHRHRRSYSLGLISILEPADRAVSRHHASGGRR
ncbi:MAG: hypothetical protein ACLRSE_11590 [Alistipes finegoldii]